MGRKAPHFRTFTISGKDFSVFVSRLVCLECEASFSIERNRYSCERCFAPLAIGYDFTGLSSTAVKERLFDTSLSALERALPFLPINELAVGRESGGTSLHPADELGRALGVLPGTFFLKLDSSNLPSGSYKDRVVAVAFSAALEQGWRAFGCASTGNLARAVAAQAQALNLPAFVLVPRSLEAHKIQAITSFGGLVILVDGTYDDVNTLCGLIAGAEDGGVAFVNVNLRPWYAEGAKTILFELFAQFGGRLPEHVVLPVAGATLIRGVSRAIRDLEHFGLVDVASCRLHVAQPSGCSPIVDAIRGGFREIRPVRTPKTIVSALAIGSPADGPTAVRAVRESGGMGVSPSDEEVLRAMEVLFATEGIAVEPAGGTTLAGYIRLVQEGVIGRDELTAVCLTGRAVGSPDAFTVPHLPVITEKLHAGVRQFREIAGL